jgi:hypothetical protein
MPEKTQAELEREADEHVFHALINATEQRTDRSKHILHALMFAQVPLDWLTAQVLIENGTRMQAILQEACEDE